MSENIKQTVAGEYSVATNRATNYSANTTGWVPREYTIRNVSIVKQPSDFKSGSELFSALTVLEYLGMFVSIDTFLNNYVDIRPYDLFDPGEHFGGDPRTTENTGCYGYAIRLFTNKFFAYKHYYYEAKVNPSLSLAAICTHYIDKDIPVLIWGTENMGTPISGRVIEYNDQSYQWLDNHHCFVLIGYDENNYKFIDCKKGEEVEYPKSQCEAAHRAQRYEMMVIEKSNVLPYEGVDFNVPQFEPVNVPTSKPVEQKNSKAKVADPVDAYSGNHLLKNDVFNLFGGQNLMFTANYNSSYFGKGDLGIGWHHNYEKKLVLECNEYYLYEGPSTYQKYTESTNIGEFVCATPDKKGYVLKNTGNGYVLDCNGEKKEYYDAEGKLIKIVNRNGFETIITHCYNAFSITDGVTGKSIYAERNTEGFISRVYDDFGRSAFLIYCGSFLVDITDVNGNNLVFSYDEQGRIVSGLDRNDIKYFENTYDSEGRVASQKDGVDNPPTLFTYGENGVRIATNRNSKQSTRIFDTNGMLTSYTDENGNTTTYTYDTRCNKTSETDPLGNRTSYVYNSFNKPTKITDKNGNITELIYDEKGNVIKIKYPKINGVSAVETFEYNDNNQMVRHTDLRGTVTVYTYDENGMPKTKTVGNRQTSYTYSNGLLTSETDPRGNTVRYVYNSFGQMTSKTDARGYTTRYTYDALGNVLTVTDPYGKTVTYTYDSNYQKRSETDARGNKSWYSYNGNMKLVSVTTPDGQTVHHNYDGEDRIIETLDQEENATLISYDDGGRTVSKTFADGGIVTYEYDDAGNVIMEINQSEAVTEKTYDAMGNVLTVKDSDGNITRYQYDAMSRVIRSVNSVSGAVTYEYSLAGDLLCETDQLGNKKTYTYDAYGNKLTATDAKGNTYTYTYDENNNMLTSTDPLDNTTTYTYNANNQVETVRNAKNCIIKYTYDALGRQIAVTDAKNKTFTTQYDANGNVLKTLDAKGNIISETAYNSLNLPSRVTDATGNTTMYTYNSRGLVKTLMDTYGRTKEFEYDAVGRNISVMDSLCNTSTAEYNTLGGITSLTGPMGCNINYTYDNMGRLISETTSAGGVITYGYNALGVKEQVTNAKGQKRNISYDALGRVTGYVSEEDSVSYTYDENGNVLTVRDKNGTVTREYDALNRVTKYTDTFGNTVEYRYDSLGNLIALIYPDETSVVYAYDANNNLVKVTDWAGRVTTYSYDENNRVIGSSKPDGTTTTTSYDNKQRVTYTAEINNCGIVISGFQYTYDGTGLISTETDLAKNQKMWYTYDELKRVTKRRLTTTGGSLIKEENFTYDAAGNIENTNAWYEDQNFVYDSNNKLIEYNGQPVTYDADGNMLSATITCMNRSFEYDSANRLVKADAYRYVYDGEDVRIKSVYYTTETEYVFNTNAKLSQLLQKSTNGVITKYVYGLGLIGEERFGTFKTYHFDYRGSTTAITDIYGNITDTFSYDTYGNLLSRSGYYTDTPFMYNGRDGVMTDNNGLIYMRARYYCPELRRFINADILHGEISDSTSLNRYSYVNGDPVSFVDPFGLIKERGSLSISDILSPSDMERIQKIYDYARFGIEGVEMSFETMYLYLRAGVEKAVRPKNINVGTWKKMIDADIKWLDDVIGPTSKFSRTLDNMIGPTIKLSKKLDGASLPWLDAVTIGTDTLIGVYENVQNGETKKEIISDVVIDAGVGTATAVAGTLLSSVVTSAVAGTAIGTAIPGIGNVAGFLVGIGVGIGGYYISKLLDDTM